MIVQGVFLDKLSAVELAMKFPGVREISAIGLEPEIVKRNPQSYTSIRRYKYYY
jgi:hypothetical protein